MRIFILSVMVSVVLQTTAGYTEEAKAKENESPIKVEMRLLNAAFINLVTALVLNNPKAIEEPFHEVHKAKAGTEKAIKKGGLKLPKNSDKMMQFVEMDERFHKEMEALIAASRKGDMKKIQDVTHRFLDGCVQCHTMFRN